jgi:tetratricopeptide (TPR) repeat protein
MEQMMKKIFNKNKNSTDSKNIKILDREQAFDQDLDQLMGRSRSHQEIAEDMIFEAIEMSKGRVRKTLVERALKIYPHLADAWIILAEEMATKPEDAVVFYRKAVDAGEKYLGAKFFKENVGHFWGMTEARPYMRARVYLAEALWNLGFEAESIEHFKDCLRLNPNDNQGLRYILEVRLLIQNDLKGAEAIHRQFNEKFSAQSSYNKALLLFKKNGPDSKQAINQLKKAVALNPLVPKYLLKKTKMPKQIPNSYSMGSKEEAIIYVDLSMRAWKESLGALAWLLHYEKENE